MRWSSVAGRCMIWPHFGGGGLAGNGAGRISEHLAWLGVQLDPAPNVLHAAVISPDDASVTVRVIPTDEERQVALHVSRLMHEDRHDGPYRPP